MRGAVPDGRYTIPIGVADVVREGADLTIVTYGVGRSWALEEAKRQESRGRSVEIVDLRTLVPLDLQTVLRSVQKTNRVLVLHEAQLTGGFGAEVAALISQVAFESLDAPVIRVGGADTPVPFSVNVEQNVYSAKVRLGEAVDRLLAY
jgi:pyruvate/2-oxoglutarate/acetoin dehydrogenase E1 component